MKLLIATPAFNSLLTAQYLQCFLKTISNLSTQHQISHFVNHRDGLVSLARNQCARHAMEHNFDRILFIDSDIVWSVDQISTLLQSDKPIIAGTYLYKRFPLQLVFNELSHPDSNLFGNKTIPEYKKAIDTIYDNDPKWNGELEVNHVPTGFLLIQTTALRSLANTAKSYTRQNTPGSPVYTEFDFFRVGISSQGTYESEDFGFCNLAKENGFKIYLQTKVVVDHIGSHTYSIRGELNEFCK